MRLIHAVRELSAETGARIETVALYTDADKSATFVREADLAYPLGPASARPYLDLGVLERALLETEADAAWVGWGFVAEDPAFAELCEKLGVTFVGPSANAMRRRAHEVVKVDAHAPFLWASRNKRHLIEDCASWCARVARDPGVLEAAAFKAILIPPFGDTTFLRLRRNARNGPKPARDTQ